MAAIPDKGKLNATHPMSQYLQNLRFTLVAALEGEGAAEVMAAAAAMPAGDRTQAVVVTGTAALAAQLL